MSEFTHGLIDIDSRKYLIQHARGEPINLFFACHMQIKTSFPKTITDWNCLPEAIVSSSSLETFKYRLTAFLKSSQSSHVFTRALACSPLSLPAFQILQNLGFIQFGYLFAFPKRQLSHTSLKSNQSRKKYSPKMYNNYIVDRLCCLKQEHFHIWKNTPVKSVLPNCPWINFK